MTDYLMWIEIERLFAVAMMLAAAIYWVWITARFHRQVKKLEQVAEQLKKLEQIIEQLPDAVHQKELGSNRTMWD